MDALGITLDSTVVLTDPFGLMPSARLWWLLKAYGLRDVWVLPGGHRGVEGLAPPAPPAAALKVTRDLAATREAAAPLPGPTELYWPSSDWARLAGGAPEGSLVLDVRSAAEFEGVDLRGNPVGGHIPGALCVPHTEFCDMTPGDGGAPTLRPAEEVLALLGEAGLAPPGNAPPIITVCQSGMRSVRGGGRCCISRCSGLYHPLSSPPSFTVPGDAGVDFSRVQCAELRGRHGTFPVLPGTLSGASPNANACIVQPCCAAERTTSPSVSTPTAAMPSMAQTLPRNCGV